MATHLATVVCPVCSRVDEIPVDLQTYYEFTQNGRQNVQQLFPNLSPDQREQLVTGTCSDCWSTLEGMGPENEIVVESDGPSGTDTVVTAKFRFWQEFITDLMMENKEGMQTVAHLVAWTCRSTKKYQRDTIDPDARIAIRFNWLDWDLVHEYIEDKVGQ